ncbi:MAG: DUF2953 domain-containing protein [bacterium]|nr:DUF2953 domain-containing protein [bacterium]
MVHILLLILKIIGILLLILLGLFFGILLLVLLVPVRYQAEISKQEQIQGNVRIHWLLHLVLIAARYQEGLSFQVKLFGFSVFPKEEKKNVEEGKEDSECEDSEYEVSERDEVSEREIPEYKISKSEVSEHEVSECEEKGFSQEELERVETGKSQEAKTLPQPSDAIKPQDTADASASKEETAGEAQPQTNPTVSKKKRLDLHSAFRTCMKSIRAKIQTVLQILRANMQTLAAQWSQKKALAKRVSAFMTSPDNQATFRLILRQGKRILKHCLPRKINGAVTMGFEDPALTGNVLAVVAVLYPVYKNQLQVTPVFGENVLEGEFSCRGHIRFGTLLVLALRLLFDRNLRNLIKKFLRRSQAAR